MNRDHLEFLCNVVELSSALTGSSDVQSALERLVRLVAQHLDAHVCSLYVYEESTSELVLRANVGLDQSSANRVRLKRGEGLVGAVLEQGQPLLDNDASSNGRFRYIPGIGEEHYNSFLAVPLLKDREKIGVLVVQREERNHFCDEDLSALRVLACQLVGCVENAQALMGVAATQCARATDADAQLTSLVRGKVASEGCASGPARVVRASRSLRDMLNALASDLSLEQFRLAVDQTTAQLEDVQLRAARMLPEAVSLIFSAHLLMLKDVGFVESMARQITQGKPVGEAVLNVVQHFVKTFASSKPLHIREKAHDVEDVGMRLARNLAGLDDVEREVARHEIVIARDVYPSELVIFSMDEPSGLVLVGGGATSHVSILARSLHLPLFITDDQHLLEIPDGTHVLLDDHTGNICVAPPEGVLAQFAARASVDNLPPNFAESNGVTETMNGTRVQLLANINLLSEVPIARDMHAAGIGLYRTEFPFMIRTSFPDEEEQYLVYRQLVQGVRNNPVTFRTLDIGGEKSLSYFNHGSENNPELGLRAIRFSLRHRSIFEEQIRAILRAGADAKDLRIMFPMIASLDEFREAREVVLQCVRELQHLAVPCQSSPQIGMMVELPSVLETAVEFAREADFFSIGSNDFVQYMLAADRGNDDVDAYYCPHHPAVLRSLARFVQIARDHGRQVAVCGEMAQQIEYIPFLLGIGVRDLSVAPHRIHSLREFIGSITIDGAQQEAEAMLNEATRAGVEEQLESAASTRGTDYEWRCATAS